MITASGVGSGLDISSLISQLVSAEGDAKTAQLAGKRSTAETKVSAYGSLKSALTSFQTSLESLASTETYTANNASSADPTIFSASITGNGLASGSYAVEVETLAESHRLISTGFADEDTSVGTGSLTISTGPDSFVITLESGSDSLSDLRDAINNADDNTGVTASLVNVDDGMGGSETKLILSANETGTDNEITVVVDDDDLDDTDAAGLSQFYYDTSDVTTPEQLTQTNAAVDSVIYIDSQQITSSSNTITSAIEGVSITLRDTLPGEEISLTVSQNTSTITSAVNTFVDRFNSLANVMRGLTVFDQAGGANGPLLGDVTMLTISSRIRQQVTDTVDGLGNDFNSIVNLGITTNADGSLSLDSSKLNDAIENNLDSVIEMFTSDNGIATTLDETLEDFVKSDGILDAKVNGLNSTIENIDESLVDLTTRLEKLEQTLTAKFTALDTLVAQLNTTSSFLTTQLSSIENITNRNSG